MLLQYLPDGGEKAVRNKIFDVLKKEYHVEFDMFVRAKVASSLALRDEVPREKSAGGLSAFRDKDEPAGSRQEPEEAMAVALAGDCRILPVSLDEAGERWRTIDHALPVMFQQEFDDWPLDSVRSAGYLMRELRRSSKTFLTSHTDW
eukprot:14285159-Heterocapsa_arctica.AAC.1